jgi:hypothetical protein
MAPSTSVAGERADLERVRHPARWSGGANAWSANYRAGGAAGAFTSGRETVSRGGCESVGGRQANGDDERNSAREGVGW